MKGKIQDEGKKGGESKGSESWKEQKQRRRRETIRNTNAKDEQRKWIEGWRRRDGGGGEESELLAPQAVETFLPAVPLTQGMKLRREGGLESH